MRKQAILSILLLIAALHCSATDASQLFYTLRTKVLSVKDYTADVKMKINVSYMRIPQLRGTLYYKAPDKMRLERKGGLSILPKKNINLTLGNLIPSGQVTVLDAGTATIGGRKARIIKVIPEDDNSNIVLAKIWIDEANMLALHTETTTRNDGTVVMDLEFAKYANYSLPDKVTIHLDLKDYKLPKGVALDYIDESAAKKEAASGKPHKGTIEIHYLKYEVNTGLRDDIFRKDNAE